MSVLRTPDSFRREQVEISRLAWAFVLSILLHLLMFGGFEMGKRLGWWQRARWPAWIQSRKALAQNLRKQEEQRQNRLQEELPLVFVEVNPVQATPEPPKKPKFYSNQNSVAANKQPEPETGTPKIEGKRPELVKTEDVPREKFVPLQPAPAPPVPEAKEPQEEVKAAPTYKPGDLTMAKPDLNPKKTEGEAKSEKPRLTVAEAKARLQQANQSPGQKMKEDGGVSRHFKFESLDTKATAFGQYDSDLVRAIQSAWYMLLEKEGYAADYRGKVMLRFRLHHDGRITDLTIVENTAGSVPGTYCESAIMNPGPYKSFPTEMRRVVGDIRSIQFTFFYD